MLFVDFVLVLFVLFFRYGFIRDVERFYWVFVKYIVEDLVWKLVLSFVSSMILSNCLYLVFF